VGDWVKITACQKKSKLKNFELAEIVRPAARFTDEYGVTHTQGLKVMAKIYWPFFVSFNCYLFSWNDCERQVEKPKDPRLKELFIGEKMAESQ
jgi:hypothetical protein